MTVDSMDEAIRALVKNVARATVEHCAEIVARAHPAVPVQQIASGLLDSRLIIAAEMIEATMECADETPDSEVHAVRSFAQ